MTNSVCPRCNMVHESAYFVQSRRDDAVLICIVCGLEEQLLLLNEKFRTNPKIKQEWIDRDNAFVEYLKREKQR